MAAITAGRLAEIVAELNAYEATHPGSMSSDVWQDVILNLPEYDESNTSTADADHDTAVLTDGTEIYYDCPARQWVAGRLSPRD